LLLVNALRSCVVMEARAIMRLKFVERMSSNISSN
jgi:hypothetical protein